jgi:LysM repeat protein
MGETYVVQRGDTLGKIAANKLGDGKRWQEIVQLNAVSNPNFLLVGQQLRLPLAQKPNNFRPTFQTPSTMDAAALSQVPASLAWARGYLLVLFNNGSTVGAASLAKDFSMLPRTVGEAAAIAERDLVVKGAPLTVDGNLCYWTPTKCGALAV